MTELSVDELCKTINNLTESKDRDRAINETLDFLGSTFYIDIISIFRIHGDRANILVSQIFRSTIESLEVNPLLHNAPIEVFTPGWLDKMKDGAIINEAVRDLPHPARTFFEAINTATIVTIPMFHDESMYGYLALNSHKERIWEDKELDIIRMFTGLIALILYKDKLKEEKELLT